MKNQKSKSIKSILVIAGLMLTSTVFAACSTAQSSDDTVNQRPTPKAIKTFVSEKSDK